MIYTDLYPVRSTYSFPNIRSRKSKYHFKFVFIPVDPTYHIQFKYITFTFTLNLQYATIQEYSNLKILPSYVEIHVYVNITELMKSKMIRQRNKTNEPSGNEQEGVTRCEQLNLLSELIRNEGKL